MNLLSSPKAIFFSLIAIVAMSYFLRSSDYLSYNFDNRSKASNSGKTLTVCESGCLYAGATGLQQAVDAAQDGDIVFIQKGKYISDNKSACFLSINQKKITIKGEGDPRGEWNGSVLFGEGHDKPDVYASRSGICGNGSEITIDSLHIKEFQGGGLTFTNSALIIKNSIIDGNDSGSTHFNNTSVLAVNNYFVANIGIQPSGQAGIKAFNNTFFGSKAINTNCNITLPPTDFVNNIVVDDELTIGAGWIYGDCPATVAQYKTKHIAYNILWKNDHPCYENHEFCDNFTGKISANPLLDVPANDQRGWRGWGGNFSLNAGSPAIGSGDPSIPGSKDMGATGGPCVDPISSICTNFIQANLPIINNSPPPENNGNGGGEGGGGGGNGHIPPTVTGLYPEPSFAWPTTVDDNGQSPTTPPNNNGGNNYPTPTPQTGRENNPPINNYLSPTGTINNPNGNNPSNPSIQNPQPTTSNLQPSIKPTPGPLIDISKTVNNTRKAIFSFLGKMEELSKLIMP